MKDGLALFSLLLISYAASAQIPDSVSGQQRLDKQNGLLGVKFGTLQSHIHGLKRVGPNSYVRPHKHSKLGPYRLKSVRYDFTNGDGQSRLFALVIHLADSNAVPQVLQLLQATYGHTKRQVDGYYQWQGSRVRLSYKYDGRIHLLNTAMTHNHYYYNPPR